MPEFLRRPIHPEPGNASINMAARLGKLFALGQTNGEPWTTDFSALTFIQGEILQIPWMTKLEKNPPNPHKPWVPLGNQTEDDNPSITRDGDDISLKSENVNPDNLMSLTMIAYQRDPRTPTLVPGAKNSFTVDVGDRSAHGAEYALRAFFVKPCAVFKIPLESVIQHIKDSVVSSSEMAAKLDGLPGVIG